MIPTASNYWLKNVRVPICLLSTDDPNLTDQATPDGLCLLDMEIASGIIAHLIPSNRTTPAERPYNLIEIPVVDWRCGLAFPCFVDLHTHLDKGHIWERTPNPDGTFSSALAASTKDAETYWQPEDLYRRMEFGLRCSYAHGTQAIRTHLDANQGQFTISLEVFQTLQKEWSDRLALQAVSLVSLDYFLTPEGEALANKIAEMGGILGGVAYPSPDLETQLERVFTLATERQLNLDFHTDETNDPASNALQTVAKVAIRQQFTGQIVCGHCCSLAVQNPETVAETLTLVKEANIGIVSLPLCNLYLQDRKPNTTPFWRGVTRLHELKQAGIPVAVASDNCRDPFYGFGDHDVLEVFNMATRIAHLDRPYENWPRIVTQTPADLMGLPQLGRVAVGLPANLILFKARTFSELLSRSQFDRIVLRDAQPIDTTLPDYAELDELINCQVRSRSTSLDRL